MAVIQRGSKPDAILDVPGVTRPMTYEEYLASPEEKRRYDVIAGWKVYRRYGEEKLTNPTVRHQLIERNIARCFEDYQTATDAGLAVASPCDVLIDRDEPRFRQPDVLFISKGRFGNRSLDDPRPLAPAPELVVEILSPSETDAQLAAKLADYRGVSVVEVWVVRSDSQTVDQIRLSVQEIAVVRTEDLTGSIESFAFAGLHMSIADVFRVR